MIQRVYPSLQVASYRDKVLKKNRGDNNVGTDIFADADKREAQRGKIGLSKLWYMHHTMYVSLHPRAICSD